MRITAISVLLLASIIMVPACIGEEPNRPVLPKNLVDKAWLNSAWRTESLSPETWYYRFTVIDAPPNSRALGIAEGHWLHPEMIRWEITKDLLIGRRTHASVLNADHEQEPGMQARYKGAPVVAYAILAHSDFDDAWETSCAGCESAPWQKRRYMKVDWSRNLVARLTRTDEHDGIFTDGMESEATYVVTGDDPSNPKRMRMGADTIDFTVRYPVYVSKAALDGVHGAIYEGDSAAPVIDVRHVFMKRAPSDFLPLAYPDYVTAADEMVSNQPGEPNKIAINHRFGFFRTSDAGRGVYDKTTGAKSPVALANATIFNIWQQSRDERGREIPLAQRTVKPIVYYTNVHHPQNLWEATKRAIDGWDRALRSAVFYAQPGMYQSIHDVPRVLVVRRNTCNVTNVDGFFARHRTIKEAAEAHAGVRMNDIINALSTPGTDYSVSAREELSALQKLERLCSALEYYTEDFAQPFRYERPGELRVNLINLDMSNHQTEWSGYGPMLSDPLSGEIISATANINMKYIDQKAHEQAQQIGLLRSDALGVGAVFGSSTKSGVESAWVDERVLTQIIARMSRGADHEAKHEASAEIALSKSEQEALRYVQENVSRAHVYDGMAKKNAHSAKAGLMDPVNYVDEISLGIAISFAHVPPHERFLKIREATYEGVLLHELGHNLGLRHNMAGSSDALNYGAQFWHNEKLPKDINNAIAMMDDGPQKALLQQCLREQERVKKNLSFFHSSRSTQDCLRQKMGMYASIMDYHASTFARSHGLGLYDLAAIKWAYGGAVEVFPEHNLKSEFHHADLSTWLRHNDYRSIPKTLFVTEGGINQRAHEPVRWDNASMSMKFPKHAVPYAYCDDAHGESAPRCRAHDFGPDMTSSAEWLTNRYWQHYFMTHFARGGAQAISAAMDDLDILSNFSSILLWYARLSKHDPEFVGSYAEKDYLQALAHGMNHFARVIGMPEPGPHVSAPTWTLEDERSFSPTIDRLAPLSTMIPFTALSECNAKSITNYVDGTLLGRGPYSVVEVPLGIGRPYHSRAVLEAGEEETLYVGTRLIKRLALLMLVSPLHQKTIATVESNDVLSMTWYRLFPNAVSKIFAAVITKSYDELGPTIAADGSIQMHDIIDPKTLEVKTSSGHHIIPALDESLALFAAQVALTFIPKSIHSEANLALGMRISCRGCSDEVNVADEKGARSVIYEHVTGERYQAAKVRSMPSIGAILLQQANAQKERVLRLEQCMANEDLRQHDPFCGCVKVRERTSFDSWQCCDESNPTCNQPNIEMVGQGVCSLSDLTMRKEQASDQLNSMIGFIDGLRRLIKQAGI